MPEPLHAHDRTIRLADPLSPEVLFINDDPLAASIDPFPLPAFPVSMEGWLMALAHHFYNFHRHGLALLMLVDVNTHLWSNPIVPTQRCSLEGASFRVLPEDLAELKPTLRVAGSFQWGATFSEDDAESMVPAFDGLHLIYWRREKTFSKHLFLRVEGVVQHIDPATVIFDDWEAFLDNHRHLLLMH
jgi:hypothetical protein